MKNLLVTGASGLLGSAICLAAKDQYRVTGTYFSHPVELPGVELVDVDLTNEQEVGSLGAKHPSVIIHCAAMTDVEVCEGRPEQAKMQNVNAAENMARLSRRVGAYFIQISTESVFDGKMGDYIEVDQPHPLNVYAQTKYDAELAVLKIAFDGAVVRTTIYGWNVVPKPSVSEWMLSKLRAGEEVTGFEDAFFSPILANDLADILLPFSEKRLAGLYHISGGQSCSKFEFAKVLAGVYGTDPRLVRPVSVDTAMFRAKRPVNVSLDVTKAERLMGMKFPDVKTGLERFKKLEDEGYVKQYRRA